MKEWGFAQTDVSQQLAQVHTFSIQKRYAGGEVEFLITVKEFLTPREPTMTFFAQTDKLTNQKTAPYRPCGWGKERRWRSHPMRMSLWCSSRMVI